MGVLNVLGPALYSGARALHDSDTAAQQKQAFETDQQTREERLSAEKEARPLRKRILEQQDELDQLNIDAAKLKKGDEETVRKEATSALKVHNTLRDALQSFHLSGGDPSHIGDALRTLDPEKAKDFKAVRNDDGSITFDGGQGHPITFRGQTKTPDGKTMNVEDEVTQFLTHYADPVKDFQERYGYAQKVGLEKEKTDRAFGVADRRASAASNRSSEAWTNRQLTQIKPVLDSMLKTQGVSGSFISGYAHNDDAELRGIMEEAVEAEVMDGTPVRQAARKVVDDTRVTYDKAMQLAKDAASKLTKAKISPRDRKAVEAAARAGNQDAKAYLQILKAAEQTFGPSVAKYLLSSMPTK